MFWNSESGEAAGRGSLTDTVSPLQVVNFDTNVRRYVQSCTLLRCAPSTTGFAFVHLYSTVMYRI